MKRSIMTVAAAFAIVPCVGLALTQPEQNAEGFSKKDIAEMLEALGGPAPEHAFLEPFTGRFEGHYSLQMGPGVPPINMNTVCEAEWILGDRFVELHVIPAKGEELKIHSRFTMGFDKRTKKFFAFGIDTTDTYPVFAEGDYDEETMTFTLYGENLEPNLGKMVPFKFIFDFENEDRYTSEVWFQMEGAPGADEDGWFPVLESVQERAEK